MHDWNLTLEKEIMRDTVLRVALRGQSCHNQDSYDDWNQSMPEYVWVTTTKTRTPADDRTPERPADFRQCPYGNLQEYRKDGWGWSNGIQIEFERRYSKGFGFQVFYMMMNTNQAAGHGWYDDSPVSPVSSFLPGTIPTDHHDRMTLAALQARHHRSEARGPLELHRGPAVRQGQADPRARQQVPERDRRRLADFQHGPLEDQLVHAALPKICGRPARRLQYYGHEYPIEDCRSGMCRPGYLMWNGYIPALPDQQRRCRRETERLHGRSRQLQARHVAALAVPGRLQRSVAAATDPNYANYGTSNIWLPITDDPESNTYRMGLYGGYIGSPVHPWINQPVLSTKLWSFDTALFKSFSISERAKLRVQADFFNTTNTPGNSFGAGSDGLVDSWTNANGARVVQLSARFTF